MSLAEAGAGEAGALGTGEGASSRRVGCSPWRPAALGEGLSSGLGAPRPRHRLPTLGAEGRASVCSPALRRRRRAPASDSGLCRAEQRTDLRDRRRSGGGTACRERSPATPCASALPCSLAGAPDLLGQAGGRPRESSRWPLKRGVGVMKGGGGWECCRFPELQSGTALPCAPRLFPLLIPRNSGGDGGRISFPSLPH